MRLVVAKGEWYRLPSGRVAEVCRIEVAVIEPPEGNPDQTPVTVEEPVVRLLNKDGAMGPSEFSLSLAFLAKHAARVKVTPFF